MRYILPLSLLLVLAACAAPGATAQTPAPANGGGQVIVPESSREQPGDAGVRSHTNVEILVLPPGAQPPCYGSACGASGQPAPAPAPTPGNSSSGQ